MTRLRGDVARTLHPYRVVLDLVGLGLLALARGAERLVSDEESTDGG